MRGEAAVTAALALSLTAPAAAQADHFIHPDIDVYVTRVSNPPAVLGIGASIRVSDTTRNRGDSTEPPSQTLYYLSRDTHRNRGDRRLGRRFLGELAPRRSSRGSIEVTIPRVRPGSYHVLACAEACRASREVAVKSSAPPVVVLNEPNLGSYVAGEPAKPIAPNLTVSDSDDALMRGATVRIVGPRSGDELAFTSQRGVVSGTYDSGTGILTLRGLATTGAYQEALRSVGYSGTGPGRRVDIEFRVRDAVRVESSPVFTSIDVTVN